ncbi:tRNA(Ile)-lysidine synthase [Nannocystis exedens]|uniref:tRNA(Ile)-lysidine synthase n=1 Tax=Nannocystis exedens TaxID=54 RepID=A0A1I1T412_9BACT|nr:tRNA lysidine(34) synthetase TilS [Nannocystis exedens]PCC66796.1 tRNA(Ile)-lysidine synthetase [Nannocystis exedens]SFD53377.1 tRNA(Ile)-lysidine synthase [Nannocystis exedens]
MPPRHPTIASALGLVRRSLRDAGSPRRILVACSGGADSTALVGLLHLLARDEALALIVAHVDHGLRRESADEAAAVARSAAQRGLPSVATRLSLSPGSGLPARAREARRAALCAFASAHACDAIALGHTATDQAETLLMHAARGCGLEGLAAMRPWEAPWLRPLLELPRAATRALCQRMALPFVDDPTNADEEQPRVRVRERVLPELRRSNPRVEAALVCLATQAGDAEEALAGWAAREEAARRRGPAACWSTDDLHILPRAVRTRVLRRICGLGGADLGALRAAVIEDIDRAVLARAAALGGTDAVLRPHVWHLRPGLHVRLDRQGLTLAGAAPGAEIPGP